NLRVERGKDDAAPGRDLELGQTVLLQLEIGRHPALDAAVTLDPAAKWQAQELAGQIVVPLMIGAGEVASISEVVLAELHAAVGTAILNDMDSVVVIADHDDGALTDPGPFEIACSGNLGLETHVKPVTPIEQAFQFASIERGDGIHRVRHPADFT